MSTPREIRRLAFQILYQLDARGGDTPAGDAGAAEAQAVLATLTEDDEEAAKFTDGDRRKAFVLATEAYADRVAADAFMGEAAPGWPAHRQAAVDRAILRLAHHEIVSGKTPPKIAVNEAIELAKTYSTEKSPAFINGLLDKALKRALGEQAESAAASVAGEVGGGAADSGGGDGGEAKGEGAGAG